MKSIYLDYAAATPMDPKVVKAMAPFLADKFHNPSAIYLAGRAAHEALEDARAQIAQNLGARPAEIIFTAGATEANNLAIQGIMRQFSDGEILVSAIEHESVLAPAKLFKHKIAPVDKQARIDLDKLTKMISDKTVLVSIGLVNNEIGTIQHLAQIAKILNPVKLRRQRSNWTGQLPLYLHTDAAQAPNYLDIHVARLGVDLLTINGGKIYGPKQSGALYIKAGLKLQPLILGGGQEGGLRAGTENVAAAVGLATALALAQTKRKTEAGRVAALRDLFIKEILERLPQAQINGSNKYGSPHILSLTFPGIDNERLMMQLDEAGIQVAVGSACSASSDEPSHVLSAVGLNSRRVRSTLRFSFGRSTTEKEVLQTVKILSRLVR